jgi:hypothetical protein
VSNAARGLLVLLLVALVIAGALAIHAPLLAAPIVFLILVVWGGQRVATARGRTS